MSFWFCEFDRKPTRVWIVVQVILLSLIVVGVGLLVTERYWVPRVVSFLLAAEGSPAVAPVSSIPVLSVNETETPPATLQSPRSSTTPAMHTSSSHFTLNVPHTVEHGHPVVLSWQLSAVPPGGSIGFFLSGGAFPVERPLTLKTVPLSGVTGSFTWDGERYGCDPLDHPAYCTDIATGAYTITARVYDKSEVSLVDGDPVVPVVHDEKVVYTSDAMPIVLTGVPQDARIETFKQVVANNINTEYLKEANPNMLWDSTATAQENRIKPFVKATTPFTGPDASGKFCMSFTLTEPFMGSFKVCGPDKTFYQETAAQFSVTGEVALVHGVLAYQTAKQHALDMVWSLYQKRVAFKDRPTDAEAGYTGDPEFYKAWFNAHPDAGTYLLADIDDWAYRTNVVLGESRTTPLHEHSYWVFKVHVQKMGSADTLLDPFDDRLVIRVSMDGVACVVQTYPYLTHTGSVLDIHTDAIDCPQ